MSSRYQTPERYEVCEREPRHCATANSVILAPFNSEKEALECADKYGYVGDNYFVRPIQKVDLPSI